MQAGKNLILPKEMNANLFFQDSHWLEIWSNHLFPSIHRKKRFTSFPSPAGMSLTKLSLGRNNSVMTSLFPPRESLVVTSRLGTGNSRTFFYGVGPNGGSVAIDSELFNCRVFSASVYCVKTTCQQKQHDPESDFLVNSPSWEKVLAEAAQRSDSGNSSCCCCWYFILH